MTTEELSALPIPSVVYLPTESTVKPFLFYGRVGTSDYYTVLAAPDEHGQVSSKKPQYWHALDLLEITREEGAAWQTVAQNLERQLHWIKTHKLASLALSS